MISNKFREQFLDANAALVAAQERAGLDILTNGDYHHDDTLGGQSWILYAPERFANVDTERPVPSTGFLPSYSPGTILNEVIGGWRYPAATGKIDEDVPQEWDKVWRIAQSFATAPVKIGTPSAQMIASFMQNRSGYYDDETMQLTWDTAVLINNELRRLVTAGCKAVQIEDPLIHLSAELGASREYIDFMVNALNKEIEGLECEVWVHTCWGNPNMQRVQDNVSYASTLEDYLYRVNCDVLTLEMQERDYADIELLGRYKDSGKKIAVGAVSHRNLQVETDAEIAENIRNCLKYVDAEKLALSSDCGFGREGFNRRVAEHKAAALVRGANIVRRELGVDVTEPRQSRRELQIDWA